MVGFTSSAAEHPCGPAGTSEKLCGDLAVVSRIQPPLGKGDRALSERSIIVLITIQLDTHLSLPDFKRDVENDTSKQTAVV